MSWGGRRAGSGRPRKLKSDASPTHSIRASKEDWEVIKPFAMLVKMGFRHECWLALADLAKRLDAKEYECPIDEETFELWFLSGDWRQ